MMYEKERHTAVKGRANLHRTALALFAAAFMVTAMAVLVTSSSAPVDDGEDTILALPTYPGNVGDEFEASGGLFRIMSVNVTEPEKSEAWLIGMADPTDTELGFGDIVVDIDHVWSPPDGAYTFAGISDEFSGYTNLERIRLPPSVSFIEPGAFSGCDNLELVFSFTDPYFATPSEIALRGYDFGPSGPVVIFNAPGADSLPMYDISVSGSTCTFVVDDGSAFWPTVDDALMMVINENSEVVASVRESMTLSFSADDGNIFIIVASKAYMVEIADQAGGTFLYRAEYGLGAITLGWMEVEGGEIWIPVGWTVEIKAVNDLGYDFEWDLTALAGDLAGVSGTVSTAGGVLAFSHGTEGVAFTVTAGVFSALIVEIDLPAVSGVEFFYWLSGDGGVTWSPLYSVTGGQIESLEGYDVRIGFTQTGVATGYEFVWDITNDGTQVGDHWILAGLMTDTVLDGDVAPIAYNITYVLNGGTNGTNPATYTILDTPLSLNDASKNGYNFAGWILGDGSAYTTAPLGDVIVYATWSAPISYGITYTLNGGTNGANPATYTIEDRIVFKDPTRTGYTFEGWFTDAGFAAGTDITEIPIGSTGVVTVFAKWEIINYNIMYVLNGGTNDASNPTTYTVAAALSLNDASKLGYNFTGWVLGDGNAYTTAPLGDVIVYATWSVISYNITYDLNGGTNDAANPATYTVEDRIVFKDPTRTGYTFEGWFTDAGFAAGTDITEIPIGSTGAVDVYAKWETIQYAITYLNVSGADLSDTSVWPTFYTVETVPAPFVLGLPTWEGYAFAYWYTDDNGMLRDISGEINITSLISGGMLGPKTYTAVWEVLDVEVTIQTSGYKGTPSFKYWISPVTGLDFFYNGDALIGEWVDIEGDQTIIAPYGSTIIIMSTSLGNYDFLWTDVVWPEILPPAGHFDCGCSCTDCMTTGECDGTECDAQCGCTHCVPLPVPPAFTPGVMVSVLLVGDDIVTEGVTVVGEYEFIHGYSYAYAIVALAIISVIVVFVAMSVGRKP